MSDSNHLEIVRKIVSQKLGLASENIQRMETGICNEVYLVKTGNDKLIVRLNSDPDEMIGSSRYIPMFKSLGINVPDLILQDYSKSEFEFAYQVRSYLEGEDLDKVIINLKESELSLIAKQIAAIIEKLSQLPTNGRFGFVGADESKLHDSWMASLGVMIREIHERSEKLQVVKKHHLDLIDEVIKKHQNYFDEVKSVFYYDDMSSKNVLIDQGKFSGLIDLDEVAYGDPLEGVGRIEASWYGTTYGEFYTNAVCKALNLDEEKREMVKVYALLNRIYWLSEKGIKFNDNTSEEIDWEAANRDYEIIDRLSKEIIN